MDFTMTETLAIAKGQKGILWCILANILLFVLIVLLGPTMRLLFLGIIPLQLYFIYKLASALKSGAPVLWMIGMFFPLISLILLLILTDRATKAIRAAGFRVGLMGATISDIEAAISAGPPPVPQNPNE